MPETIMLSKVRAQFNTGMLHPSTIDKLIEVAGLALTVEDVVLGNRLICTGHEDVDDALRALIAGTTGVYR